MNIETAQTEKRLTKKFRRQARLDNHYRRCFNLARLCGHPNPDGKKISVALWKLEKEAHDSATAQCNGAAYNGQPFRPSWDESGEESDCTPWDAYRETVNARLAKILGKLPDGFRFNSDARGYALKIDPDREGGAALIKAAQLETDWGGNGILSPEITGDE
jgi:hypothetical protein